MKLFIKSFFVVFFVNFLLIFLFENFLEIERSAPLLMVFQIALMTVYMAFFSKNSMEKFGICLPNKESWFSAVFWVLLLSVITNICLRSFTRGQMHPIFSNYSDVEILFIFTVCSPISQELLFRGWVMQIVEPLKRRGLLLAGIFLSFPVLISTLWFILDQLDLFFMEMSIPFVLIAIASALFFGVLAGYYREKTKSLFVPIILHSIFNLVTCVFYYSNRL